MKRIVTQFRQHRNAIEMFLRNRMLGENFNFENEEGVRSAFHHLPFLQMVYVIGSDLKQKSPNYYRKGMDASRIGTDKSHYFANIELDKFKSYVTNPYIHHMTGESSITMVLPYSDGGFIVFDFTLLKLLETLHLIEHNVYFEHFNQFIYALGGFSLIMIAVFLIGYGEYTFFVVFYQPPDGILHDIFKSIVAVTLGLAIYDLAKTILENEVMYKNAGKQSEGQYTVLGKFLAAIIIALSIESLMVVFKITLGDYTGLGYGFLLILGVTLMIVGLGWFDFLTKKKGAQQDE